MADATSTENLRHRVAALLGDAMSTVIEVTGDLSLHDLPEWDSLKQIEFIFMVEEEFGVRLSPEEVGTKETLDELVAAVESAC